MARVFVAMSGGVDSSVGAALLLEQGHDVTGVTMQLWPSTDAEGGCCSVDAIRDAKRVCDLLGIPHYALNYREIFEREVVAPFAHEYARGRTPNPCIVCNDRLKFADLLAKVALQGAEFLATGHYARIVRDAEGAPWLARGLDADKDQSYFLYRLTREQMNRVLFPVGALHKSDVRAIAERFGLPVARKAESQDICFATAGGGHIGVIQQRARGALAEGDIVDASGAVLGTHRGLAHYTVGQRKGLGIASAHGPLFVIALDAERNRVVVGPESALEASHVRAVDVVWHGATAAEGSSDEERVEAAVRYRMRAMPASATLTGSALEAAFDEPLLGVAPGQSLVCYREDVVVGGGVIECAS